jgi:hypothetical protein
MSVAGDKVAKQRSSELGGFLMFSALKGASAGNSCRSTSQADARYCKYTSLIAFQSAKREHSCFQHISIHVI